MENHESSTSAQVAVAFFSQDVPGNANICSTDLNKSWTSINLVAVIYMINGLFEFTLFAYCLFHLPFLFYFKISKLMHILMPIEHIYMSSFRLESSFSKSNEKKTLTDEVFKKTLKSVLEKKSWKAFQRNFVFLKQREKDAQEQDSVSEKFWRQFEKPTSKMLFPTIKFLPLGLKFLLSVVFFFGQFSTF